MRPLLPFSRTVYITGVCLTVGTGIGLYAVPDRTADYWAWTIKAPLSAAFFGAGYISAAMALILAARAREWEPTRIVAVEVFSLTSLALLATLLDHGTFAFGAGGLSEVVAWVWLVVYVVLPPAALAIFVLQERQPGTTIEHEPASPLALRIVFTGAGLGLAICGLALVADWRALADRWPWPLPELPARVVGAWLLTYGAAMLWFALRERTWRRARFGLVPAGISLALDLGAAVRYSDDLRGGASTAVYLSVTAGLLVLLAAAAIVGERQLSSTR